MRGFTKTSITFFVCIALLLGIDSRSSFGKSDAHFNVGIYHNPPLVFQSETGEPQGIYVDLLNAIANEAGWDINYVYDDWSALLNKLKVGEIDFLVAAAKSPKREAFMHFSTPVLTVWGTVYQLTGSPISSMKTLSGKRIGLLENDIHGINFKRYAKRFGLAYRFHTYSSWDQVYQGLLGKEIDALVVNSLYGFYSESLYPVQETGIQFSPIKIYIGESSFLPVLIRTKLDEILQQWRVTEDSPYQQIMNRWMTIGDQKVIWPNWLTPFLYIVLAGFVLGMVFIFALKKLVTLKAEALEQEEQVRRAKDKALYDLREKMDLFTHAMPDPGFIINKAGYFEAVYVSDPSKIIMPEMATMDQHTLLTINISDIISDKERLNFLQETIQGVLATGEELRVEYPVLLLGKNRIMEAQVSQIDAERVIWISRDITRRISLESQLARMTMYDDTTGVANRKLLLDRLDMAIGLAHRERQYSALILLDLDDFKQINDFHGHALGDKVLKEAALSLQTTIRETDTIARLGGDEFAIILNMLDSPENVLNVIDELKSALLNCMKSVFPDLEVTANYGAALWTKGLSKTLWMKHADLALNEAKRMGKNRFHLFSEQLDEQFDKEASILAKLKPALELRSFYMVYQPQFSSEGHNLVGLEALIRWQDGAHLISPGVFIPVAERHHLIAPITWLTLKWVCEDINQWLAEGICPPKVAVNLSPIVMKHEDWAEMIEAEIDASGVPPERIEIEITEGALVENLALTLESMHCLKQQGVHFSIDDFGTGYSSMQYLEKLPVDKLKIDQSFVFHMEHSANLAIIRSIITLAHSLGMTVIAEGVETEQQLKQLQAYDCDEIQGFLWSKPLNIRDLEQTLKEHIFDNGLSNQAKS